MQHISRKWAEELGISEDTRRILNGQGVRGDISKFTADGQLKYAIEMNGYDQSKNMEDVWEEVVSTSSFPGFTEEQKLEVVMAIRHIPNSVDTPSNELEDAILLYNTLAAEFIREVRYKVHED